MHGRCREYLSYREKYSRLTVEDPADALYKLQQMYKL